MGNWRVCKAKAGSMGEATSSVEVVVSLCCFINTARLWCVDEGQGSSSPPKAVFVVGLDSMWTFKQTIEGGEVA